MWECPFFIELASCKQRSDRSSGSSQHVLCVSPYPHYRKDRPTNPCMYWINDYNGDKFNVGTASGGPDSKTPCSVELHFGACTEGAYVASCTSWLLHRHLPMTSKEVDAADAGSPH